MFKRVFGLFTSSTRDLSNTTNDDDVEKKERKQQQQQQQQKLRQLQRHSRIRPKTDSHLNHAKIKAQAQAQVKVKTTTKTKLRSKTTDRNSSINNALISLIPLPQLLKLGYRLSLTVVTDSHQQQTLNDTLIDDSIDNNDISNSNSRNFPPSSPTKQAMVQHKAQTRDHNINTHKLDQYQQVDLQPIDPLRQQQQQQLNDKIVVPPVSSSSPLPPSSPIGKKRPHDQKHSPNTWKFHGGNIPKRRKLTRAALATTGNIRTNSGNNFNDQLTSSKSSMNLPLKKYNTIATTTTTNNNNNNGVKQIKGVNQLQLQQNSYKLNPPKSAPIIITTTTTTTTTHNHHNLSEDIDHYGHSRLKNLRKPSIPSMATPLIPSSSSGSGSGSGITTHQVSKPQQQKQINEIQDQANDHDTSVDIVPETIDNNNNNNNDDDDFINDEFDYDPIDSVEPEINSSKEEEVKEQDVDNEVVKKKYCQKGC